MYDAAPRGGGSALFLGANDCTPEINTSEIICYCCISVLLCFVCELYVGDKGIARQTIGASEIIADFQWRCPMYFQWRFPTESHLSAVLSKGLSLVRWICTGSVEWISVTISDEI